MYICPNDGAALGVKTALYGTTIVTVHSPTTLSVTLMVTGRPSSSAGLLFFGPPHEVEGDGFHGVGWVFIQRPVRRLADARRPQVRGLRHTDKSAFL